MHVVMNNYMYDLLHCMCSTVINSGANPDWRHAETFENRIYLYMYCGLGSQQRSLESDSHAEKYISPRVGHRDKPDTILAFYRIDPFPQTISNYWLMTYFE